MTVFRRSVFPLRGIPVPFAAAVTVRRRAPLASRIRTAALAAYAVQVRACAT